MARFLACFVSEQCELGAIFYSAGVITLRDLVLIDLRSQLLPLKLGELTINLCELCEFRY